MLPTEKEKRHAVEFTDYGQGDQLATEFSATKCLARENIHAIWTRARFPFTGFEYYRREINSEHFLFIPVRSDRSNLRAIEKVANSNDERGKVCIAQWETVERW